MTNEPTPGDKTIARSSPTSRPGAPRGLRPALTPAAGGTEWHLPGAGSKEDQTSKIRLTKVSTVRGDCHGWRRLGVVTREVVDGAPA
jgi:hypothetical protein